MLYQKPCYNKPCYKEVVVYCLHHSEKMRLDISCKLSAFFQLKCNIFMKIGYRII